jgi:hypothetical protein
MATVYASIGNTDDKLSQDKWASFLADFRRLMMRSDFATTVYGDWVSEPSSPYQNACIAIETDALFTLRATLAALGRDYGQDSIAFVVVPVTEFL